MLCLYDLDELSIKIFFIPQYNIIVINIKSKVKHISSVLC